MALAPDDTALGYIDYSNYAFVASLALLYYDYLLTLPAELAHVWPRARARAPGALWFLANRYVSVLGSGASFVVGWRARSVEECEKYSLAHQLLLTIAQLLVVALLFIRTYALYGRSRRILCVLGGTVLALAAASLWTLGGQKTTPLVTPGRGCHLYMPQSTAIRISLIWWSQVVFDALVFWLTIAKTWKARMPLAPGASERDLLLVLRRDGAMYFGVMALANLMVIISFYTFHPYARGSLAPLASSTSVTLMSRLLLNLHRAASPHASLTSRRRTGPSLSFATSTQSDDVGVLSTQLGDAEERKDWWAGEVGAGREEDGRGVPPVALGRGGDVEMDGRGRVGFGGGA